MPRRCPAKRLALTPGFPCPFDDAPPPPVFAPLTDVPRPQTPATPEHKSTPLPSKDDEEESTKEAPIISAALSVANDSASAAPTTNDGCRHNSWHGSHPTIAVSPSMMTVGDSSSAPGLLAAASVSAPQSGLQCDVALLPLLPTLGAAAVAPPRTDVCSPSAWSTTSVPSGRSILSPSRSPLTVAVPHDPPVPLPLPSTDREAPLQAFTQVRGPTQAVHVQTPPQAAVAKSVLSDPSTAAVSAPSALPTTSSVHTPSVSDSPIVAAECRAQGPPSGRGHGVQAPLGAPGGSAPRGRGYTKLFVGQVPPRHDAYAWLSELFAPYSAHEIQLRYRKGRWSAFVWCGSKAQATAAINALDAMKYCNAGQWYSLCVEPATN